MKLESIELRNAGPITGPVSIGPMADDLNVLTARNEAGKTTLLMVAARALFDRHNVTGDSIESLRPAGTNLAPDVTVVFLTVEGRFKIHKRFLHSPVSELSEDRDGEWQPIADGDAADGRILELIGGVRSGRGATKAEHWGLLRYLWARQGETADWPAWDDEAGVRIRTELAQVDIDPLVERLGNQFRDAQSEQFTATGRVSKNSPLHVEQQTKERLESELAEIRRQMDDVEGQSQDLQQLHEELVVRDRERAEAEEQASALTQTLKQVELLQKDLDRYEGDFAAAKERVNAIHREKEALSKAAAALQKAKEDLTERQSEENRAQKQEKAARQELSALQDRGKALQKKLDLARKRVSRLHEIQDLRGMEQDLETLRERLAAVLKQQNTLDPLRRKRAALPDVTKRQVTRLEQLEQALRELTIRAEAVGLRVGLTPKNRSDVSVDRDGNEETLAISQGETATITAARSLRLTLPEWGELHISNGAEEAAEIEQEIDKSRAALEKELKKLGVSSIDNARTAVEKVKDLDREIKAAEARLTELLEDGENSEALVAKADKIEAETEKRRTQLSIRKSKALLSQAELKAELTTIQATLEADETAWTTLQESIETQGKRIESCGAACSEATKRVNETKNRLASLKSQTATINERYPDGIDKTEEGAQTGFVEAKAQLDVSRKEMPDDWEKLGARHERALKSAQQAAKEFHEVRQRTQKVEILLEQAGSQGLYSRETTLEETLAIAKVEVGRLHDRALANRFLAGLIDYRKKAAVSTVLKPLEDQLSATFADITGVHNRRVFLDENLQVAGIGRKRDESYGFARLSQGAREQLLLALRAAVALELAKTGPQLLILDDVLVNTDATRQQNVLDFIGNVAQHVQVLIVTCHADRYRGIGHVLEMNKGA